MSQSRVTPKFDSLMGLMKLHHTARMFMLLYIDPRVSPLLKIAAAGGMIYKFSPLDVEPDSITGIGLLDDIIISLIIMQAFIEMAPDHVIDEKCERYGIDRGKVFVDVPQTIEEAQALYRMARRYGLGAANAWNRFAEDAMPSSRADEAEERPAEPAPDSVTGVTGEDRQEERERPRYSGYSAFNPDA